MNLILTIPPGNSGAFSYLRAVEAGHESGAPVDYSAPPTSSDHLSTQALPVRERHSISGHKFLGYSLCWSEVEVEEVVEVKQLHFWRGVGEVAILAAKSPTEVVGRT